MHGAKQQDYTNQQNSLDQKEKEKEKGKSELLCRVSQSMINKYLGSEKFGIGCHFYANLTTALILVGKVHQTQPTVI